MDYQIESHEDEKNHIDEYFYYDFDDCYVEEIDMVAAYDGNDFQSYISNDDPFDNLDGNYYEY